MLVGGRPAGRHALIARGATLILYTDGLVEDRETDVDSGVARLCALVAAHDPVLGVAKLCDRLLDELLTGPRTDDAAVIAVRISDSWGYDPAPRRARSAERGGRARAGRRSRSGRPAGS